MLTEKDLSQLRDKGISVDKLEEQVENFKKGFPFIELLKPATPDDGIISFDQNEAAELAALYDGKMKSLNLVKFVPASGAASRMFKHLYRFLEEPESKEKDESELFQADSIQSPYYFIKHLQDFAFYEDLKKKISVDGYNLEFEKENKNYRLIIEYLLNEKGLNYSSLPKALLLFHKYRDGARCSIEEHLVEGVMYCNNLKDEVNLHFTVSPEHIPDFNTVLPGLIIEYERKFEVRFQIGLSVQKPSTDTVAVDMENDLFRDDDESILFRPGGHGALLENLNELKADMVFIKNIDNVVPDRLKGPTVFYKKVLGGCLISIQNQLHAYLRALENSDLNDTLMAEIEKFAMEKLMICFHNDYDQFSKKEKIAYLFKKLNRPVRVCGMVKNKGEPGGGPFWIKGPDNEISLQIVESSQINLQNSDQAEILKMATHFNPVDLVCSTINYKGNQFNLHDFMDPSTGFISIKSKNGRNLKAQELPGLWNGAMADWITIFIDVPIITFNPVKTVNDLLREEHLSIA